MLRPRSKTGTGSTVSKLGGLKLVSASLSSMQAAFALHAVVERGGGRRLQHARHGPGDVGELDELALALEDGGVVGVEADDKAGEHPEARLLNDADLLDVVAAQVLELARFLQRFGRWRLDADEDVHEVGFDHGVRSSGRSARLMRGFGVEREGVVVLRPAMPRVRAASASAL